MSHASSLFPSCGVEASIRKQRGCLARVSFRNRRCDVAGARHIGPRTRRHRTVDRDRANDGHLYHVEAKYGREVIDRVRVNQANQLRHLKPARKVLKSSWRLLLRNRHNLKPDQAVHLKELLAVNQSLLCVYVLRDELKLLRFYRKPAWAQKACRQAPGLRVSRGGILPPQDPCCVPRNPAVNKKMHSGDPSISRFGTIPGGLIAPIRDTCRGTYTMPPSSNHGSKTQAVRKTDV